MKLRLPPEAQTWPRVEPVERRPGDQRRVRESRTPGGRELLVQVAIARAAKEIAVDAGEITRDAFVAGDGFDAIDRGRVALRDDARATRSMHPLDLGVARVDHIRQMGAGR